MCSVLFQCIGYGHQMMWSVLFQYIGYARKYVHPKIGPEAAKVLQVARIFSQ